MDIDLTGLVLPERVEAVGASEDGRSARVVVEPLERGFGHTLGNAVRRVLLSSLRGSAIWGVRMDGVVHEHQTASGVVEDVHQIIQNLKALVVVMDADVDEATLEIRASGPGAITAGMATAPAGVQVLDADHHILTLQEEREISIQLHVNKGRGFVLADQHALPRGGEAVGLVRIDAIYNPVRRANFTVEETRVGQRTDFDRLSIDIETDGSVSPVDAVRYAAGLVRKHFEYLVFFGEGSTAQGAPAGSVALSDQVQDLLSRSIEDLAELSVRSRNSLQKENIRSVGDLVRRSEDEMLAIENFGKKSLKEIQDFLADHELRFGMQIESGDDGRMFLIEETASEAAGE